MTQVEITCRLVPCPKCQSPMVLENGVAQGEVTFWTKDGVFDAVTPHTTDCEYRGKALP